MSSDPVGELPGIGSKTAERLVDDHGIETVDELSIAFFGDRGKEVAESLHSPMKVVGPLYRATRDTVPNSTFGVDKSRYRVLDVMAFIRVFGVGASCLTDDFVTSYAVGSKYDLEPGDFVFSHGNVVDADNILMYAYWGIPQDFDEDEFVPAESVDATEELVEFEGAETASTVKSKFLDGVARITGRDYRDGDVSMVQVSSEHDDFPILVYDEEIPGRYLIAPRISG